MKSQRIRDPIHDLISFSPKSDEAIWQLLQTTPMQRLRRVKQLGFSEFVYPGATHTRFSHALGAMQMARRMLAAFERTDVIGASGTNHESMKKVTIAAALLHDVGHGPYSHVFEELSEDCGVEKSHEEWTSEIIKETNISEILKKEGLFEDVVSFFDTEKSYTPYSAIISSQLDCDRLDFLCRDRYFCGLRSSYIDLEWLFDSLLIEKVVVDLEKDVEQYSFVVHPKGLRVVEEFVISYLKMYNDVYFHKTTRAVQHMIVDLIKFTLNSGENSEKLSRNNIIRFLRDTNFRDIERYLSMDDSSIVSLIHEIAEAGPAEAAILAQRYLRRDLYKCIEIPNTDDGPPRRRIKDFIDALKSENIYHKLDLIKGRSYKQYEVADKKFLENILIKKGRDHERLHNASKIVRSIPNQSTRIYFNDAEQRAKAELILNTAS
jgi:uncharacterized protein